MYPNYNYSSQGGGYQNSGYGGSAPQGNYPGSAAQGGYPGQGPQGYNPGDFQSSAQQSGYPGQPQPNRFAGSAPANMGGYQGGPQYSNFPGAGVSPEVQQWFSTVDRDRSGKINAKELQAALVNGQGKNFSETVCVLMVGMFDKDKSGTIDINEFQELYNYINSWLTVFRTYDRDHSGHIEEGELTQAMQQMGFRFSPEFVKTLIMKSDPQNRRQMSVDQFIVFCVQIQRFTEAFRARDKEMKGVISIGFEDFLGVVLTCSV